MKVPKFQSSIPPIQKGDTGDSLVASINDRIRRIEQSLGNVSNVTNVTQVTGSGGSGSFFYETPAGTLGGTVFTLTHAPNPPSSLVLRTNGVIQLIGLDITLSGLTITYAKNTDPGDWHFAGYSF